MRTYLLPAGSVEDIEIHPTAYAGRHRGVY
jgi:hypothetical protein